MSQSATSTGFLNTSRNGDSNTSLGIKIEKEVANAFVKRQKRSSLYEWYSEYYKSPMEQMHERCENYPPCDYLSDQIGFSMAYNRFFGRY
ncbi:osteocalcin-like isoform X2 [Phalacrocorax aristotelis]|uniref:osteocalcin-like isoform X2 n=1 Tax=Phalacrocorax aristotelis TaxID=126867 RepID=UPI003F4C42BC